VRDGRLLHVLSIPGSEGVYPSVLALAPRFTVSGKGADGPLLALTGAHLAGQDAAVLARCQGVSRSCCTHPPAAAPFTVRSLAGSRGFCRTPRASAGIGWLTCCCALLAAKTRGMSKCIASSMAVSMTVVRLTSCRVLPAAAHGGAGAGGGGRGGMRVGGGAAASGRAAGRPAAGGALDVPLHLPAVAHSGREIVYEALRLACQHCWDCISVPHCSPDETAGHTRRLPVRRGLGSGAAQRAGC
jgi:hypothetical protein